MRITGLIAEYNPFHNGHKYHIEQAKAITGADAVIVVMSGDFVQRGMPAILPKHMRAKAALEAGASAVLELPVCYATGSAEYFAYGAVLLLEKLGCVDSICFGSECGDMELLQKAANVLVDEPAEYREALHRFVRAGDSFPLARQKALAAYVSPEVLSEPNNILGLEYLKALARIGSEMKPYTIRRVYSQYHDTDLQEEFSSATAIRKQILSGNMEVLAGQVPVKFLTDLQEASPLHANDFSLLLKYRLLVETKESLLAYADVSEDLANRIINRRNQFQNFEQFCLLLKTREITYSRISRALTHILLGLKNGDDTGIHYARVLGFCKRDRAVLAQIKRDGEVPMLTKLTASRTLDDAAQKMLATDAFASDLYESVVSDKYGTKFVNEYEKEIIILE